MMSIRRKVESLAMRTPIQIFHTKLTTSRFITTSSRRPLLNTSSSQFTDGALRSAVPRLSSVVGSITSQTPAFSSLVVPTTRGMHTNLVIDEKREIRVMSPEELEQKINRFKKLATEARLCMQDCFESIETEYFAEELQSAKMAVETAGMAYSELLEELAITDEGIPLLNEIRKLYAPAVESLRQELRGIVKDVEDET
eukprot:g10701.t1 g10701   contig4:2374093-2374799(+)